MINPMKIKQRKIYLESDGFSYPRENLNLLESNARRGNLYDMELYINEWTNYNVDNSLSLNNVISIIDEFCTKNTKDVSITKLSYLIENTIIPRIKDSKNNMYKIIECTNRNNLSSLSLYMKANQISTYDRILRNQRIIDENCDFNQEAETLVYDICNMLLETNITTNDKYTISLENSIYTIYNKALKDEFVCEETEDVCDIVDLFFAASLNENFNYNQLNIISEGDVLSAFDGVIVGGLLGASMVASCTDKQIISKLNKNKLKDYEKHESLTPLSNLDYEKTSIISTFINNEKATGVVDTNFTRQKINGREYLFLSLYTDTSLSRILCIYESKHNEIVLVPVYATMLSGDIKPIKITRQVPYTESFINEDKKIKKLAKKAKGDTKEITAEFKKILAEKGEITASKLRSLITKFFTRSEESIIDDLPDLFTCIRVSIVAGSFIVNPYLGCLTLMADYFMKLHVRRNQRDKVIKKYESEIEKTKKKIDKCKSDKTKEDLKKYLKKLEDDKNTIDTFYDKYFTQDEIYNRNSSLDDDDFDIDFEDDFNLDESGQIVLNELALSSKLKLAQQNFKKALVRMSDKEKTVSNQMDHAYDKFIYQFEKAMSNKNREAVIKGSLLPSLSSMIKLACIAGTAAFVSPVLGVITVLGGLAASKQATANERKYILDEIDVQLKVVQKKLDLAESNNDMKAYEQLLKIQRQLESERSRLIYKKRRPVIATSYK